ncbi:MAG: hypothetical protein QOH08_2065 [Chloroflexota bacterium]|nr:hypothetical protein [Chloroflexota bacterium]
MARSRPLARVPLLDRAHAPAGALVNVLLRLAILVMSVDALVNAGDERFSGKALGPRDVIISFGFAMVFPAIWKLRYRKKEWSAYPWWYDDLYLSIFFVDMLGNSLNLYNAWEHWDHIPHFHGPGALALVIAGAFGEPIISAIGIATLLHVILEIQEFYGDLILHTHNVRDTQDSMNDLLFGVLGVLVYGAIWYRASWLQRKRAKPMKKPKA